MKLDPIFWWCYLNLFENEDDFIEMNIGYRFDEPKRVTDDIYKFTKSCKNFGQFFNNWEEIEWRNSAFPLRKHGIDNFIVRSYFANKPEYVFPPTSNCVMCFNHTEIELFDNFVYEPEKMQWAIDQEIRTGNRFNMQISLTDLKNKKYTSEEIRKMVKVEKQFTCNCTD